MEISNIISLGDCCEKILSNLIIDIVEIVSSINITALHIHICRNAIFCAIKICEVSETFLMILKDIWNFNDLYNYFFYVYKNKV